MDSWVMYHLRKVVLNVSTVVAAMFWPRCSTPYSTVVSTNATTLELISPNILSTNGLKFSCRTIVYIGPLTFSNVPKCTKSLFAYVIIRFKCLRFPS